MSNSNSQSPTKVFTNWLFRVMSAWFGVYIKEKILEPIHTAEQIADTFTIREVGSQDNVEAIVNFFAAAATMTDSDSTTRAYLGSDTDSSGKVHKWGTNESYVRTADRNPAAGATIYASDGTTDTGKTVASLAYPTTGNITQDWGDGQGSIAHTISSTTMYIGGETVTA